MQHEIEYPYVVGKGGVNFGEIQKGLGNEEFFSGVVDGGSGRKLVVTVAPNYLEVSDAVSPALVLSCGLDDNAALHFNYRTKEDLTRRHPDLFAREFIGLALQHFSSADRIVASWVAPLADEPESTNFQGYMKRRKEGKSALEAAADTWSGRLYSDLGFELSKVKEQSTSIEAEFVRTK